MNKPTEDELIKMMFPKPLEVKDLPTDKLQELQESIKKELEGRSYPSLVNEFMHLRTKYKEQKLLLDQTEDEIRTLDARLKEIDASIPKHTTSKNDGSYKAETKETTWIAKMPEEPSDLMKEIYSMPVHYEELKRRENPFPEDSDEAFDKDNF